MGLHRERKEGREKERKGRNKNREGVADIEIRTTGELNSGIRGSAGSEGVGVGICI